MKIQNQISINNFASLNGFSELTDEELEQITGGNSAVTAGKIVGAAAAFALMGFQAWVGMGCPGWEAFLVI